MRNLNVNHFTRSPRPNDALKVYVNHRSTLLERRSGFRRLVHWWLTCDQICREIDWRSWEFPPCHRFLRRSTSVLDKQATVHPPRSEGEFFGWSKMSFHSAHAPVDICRGYHWLPNPMPTIGNSKLKIKLHGFKFKRHFPMAEVTQFNSRIRLVISSHYCFRSWAYWELNYAI